MVTRIISLSLIALLWLATGIWAQQTYTTSLTTQSAGQDAKLQALFTKENADRAARMPPDPALNDIPDYLRFLLRSALLSALATEVRDRAIKLRDVFPTLTTGEQLAILNACGAPCQ